MRALRREEKLVIVITFLILAAFFLPYYGTFEGYEVFLTIITFLYSILAGFSIASAWEEYSASTNAVSKEISATINLYNLLKGFDKRAQKKFVDLLDRYIILITIIPWQDLSKLNKLHRKIADVVRGLKVRTAKQEVLFESILGNLSDWSAAREEQIYLGGRKIPFYQWLMLLILAGLLILFLFFVRSTELFSIIITVVFSFSIILILFLIRDLDTYEFAAESWEEPTQAVFETIGKKRFYWEKHIKDGTMTPPKGIKYRTKIPKGYMKELG